MHSEKSRLSANDLFSVVELSTEWRTTVKLGLHIILNYLLRGVLKQSHYQTNKANDLLPINTY